MRARLLLTSLAGGVSSIALAAGLDVHGTRVVRAAPAAKNVAALQAVLQRQLDDYRKARGTAEHLTALTLTVRLSKDAPPIDVYSGRTRVGGPAVTGQSLYQIGSNTKAFTAVAVLQLEAQGRLSIDAPLRDYLPQYPAYGALTLRRLLNMTAGIESYDNTPAWERQYARNPMQNVSADALIRLVYPKILAPPGTKYYYSNTGYLLAQEAVAARSRSKSFEKEIARIIASAGLNDTYYTSNLYPAAVRKRVTAGYYANDDAGFGTFVGKDMSGYSLSWAQGAGAIVSTPRDVTMWARALYRGDMLPATQEKELLSLVSVRSAKPLAAPTANDPAGFGLGVAERFDPKLGTFWFYQGETLGFRAAHLYFPASGLVVGIFANSRPRESDSRLQTLFGSLYSSITAESEQPVSKRGDRGTHAVVNAEFAEQVEQMRLDGRRGAR